MLILLIILLVIFFGWFFRRNKWLFGLKNTFEKHKQLGFPALTTHEQCELLYPLDAKTKDIIKTKTGIYEEYPDTVLDYYVTIGKNEMIQHLRKKDFRNDWKYIGSLYGKSYRRNIL